MSVLRDSPERLRSWVFVIMGASAIGILGGVMLPAAESELKRALYTASLGLLYGSLFGGLVKLLLDDLDRERQQRTEHVQFLSTVFTDLKAVYDRAERARVLLFANRSAATLGREMRDLIDARTRLLAVKRALPINTHDTTRRIRELNEDVDTMAAYLDELITEFSEKYRGLSEAQQVYEEAMKAYAAKAAAKPTELPPLPKNEPWDQMKTLRLLRDFIGIDPDDEKRRMPDQKKTTYGARFAGPLEHATRALTQELEELLAGNATTVAYGPSSRIGSEAEPSATAR